MSVNVSRSSDGTNATYSIDITGPVAIADGIAAEASELIYNDCDWIRNAYGNVEWATLNNPQKMHIIGMWTQRRLREIGYKQYYSSQASSIEDLDTHYGSET